MEIDKKLYGDIKEYCKLNNLKVNAFINNLLRRAFNIEKYGEAPFFPLIENSISSISDGKVVEKKIEIEENSVDITTNKIVGEEGVNLVKIKKSNKRKLN